MALARQAANVARGWRQTLVDEAAKSAAVVLLDLVQPRARAVIDEHRSEGRLLVLATTTPYDLVKPLADLLGFDDVVATRYGVADDGTYNGTIVGNFVWANGKLAAVRKWADEHGVDLASSYFYSDSVYDTPLLSAVGHPFAVNPDPGLRLVASARRWPTLHLDVPDGVPKFLGFEPQQVAMAFTRPELVLYARFDIAGVERIPNRGPAIIVGEPPQLLRHHRDGDAVLEGGPARALPRQERGLRRPRRGSGREGVRWHPRRSRHRLGRAVEGSGRRARHGRPRGDHAAGHHPARARRSSIPCSRVVGALPVSRTPRACR